VDLPTSRDRETDFTIETTARLCVTASYRYPLYEHTVSARYLHRRTRSEARGATCTVWVLQAILFAQPWIDNRNRYETRHHEGAFAPRQPTGECGPA